MSALLESPKAIVIPTRSFYSAQQVSPQSRQAILSGSGAKSSNATISPKTKPRNTQNQSRINTNRGVKHKIRRRQDAVSLRSLQPIGIDTILCNIRNENLRNRIETKRLEKKQIQEVHDILRKSRNPIELARPLRALNMIDDSNNNNNNNDIKKDVDNNHIEKALDTMDFSDCDSSVSSEKAIESESCNDSPTLQENMDNIIKSPSTSRPGTPIGQRKFFKSGRTASMPKEVRITENIRALVCNGKMTLISEKRKLPKKNTAADFSVAQAAVDVIIKNLDDHNDSAHIVVDKKRDDIENVPCNQDKPTSDIESLESSKYDDFRKRIPYKTDDPVIIEEQNFLIDFLITHDICTEENFDIFLADPDNHKDKAMKIVNEVLSVGKDVDDEDDDLSPESPDITEASKVIDKDNQKLFPIFYPGQCQPLVKKFKRPSRIWNGGYGPSQYQIDAGQKEFGAKQCKQCGLVYGAHEPEEEKLHRDFHSSLHVLRFKGWIDEDRVEDYPEWGRDGRIIRITESAFTKRRERLNEILKIVDKELGFSSYIIPKAFVAYLAVRNCMIVGFCLVEPIKKAHKYMQMNGVDCCSIEEFEAKCGISRIWVSPLHRRMHIAQKLVQAVQKNSIIGEEIPLKKIAFSAPTEDGKRFAQKIMGTTNFLVYQ